MLTVSFEKFERLAIMSDIPKNEWGRILTSKLDSQFDRVINSIPCDNMKDYEIIVGELRKQFSLDSTYYRKEFKTLCQDKEESTMSFFNRSNAALFKWLASENLEIDSNAHEQVRMLLDFMIKDEYMSKITNFREKVMYIKQNKVGSIQQLAVVADRFDQSYTGPSYKWNEQDNRLNKTRIHDTNGGLGNNHVGKSFNPDGVRHRNWRSDSSNQNNNRYQEQRQTQNRTYNNRAINALVLDNRNTRNNIKCNYCFRTNHTDNDCYYKPVNTQNNNRSRQDGQFRNQEGRNNWMSNRNEHVRYMEEQNTESNQQGQEGITFNRDIEFTNNTAVKHRETDAMEFNEHNRLHHSICATFVDRFT